jgi:hypothetical protein
MGSPDRVRPSASCRIPMSVATRWEIAFSGLM